MVSGTVSTFLVGTLAEVVADVLTVVLYLFRFLLACSLHGREAAGDPSMKDQLSGERQQIDVLHISTLKRRAFSF